MNLLTHGSGNLDEVVFANRNKTYGAYDLRKQYDSHLFKAISTTLLFFLLLYVSVYVKGILYHPAPPVPPVDKTYELINPHDLVMTIVISEKPNIPEVRLDSRRSDRGPMVITNEPIRNTIQTHTTEIVPLHPAGSAPGAGPLSPGGSKGLNITLGGPVPTFVPPTKDFVEHPDVLPEFPGGMASMLAFLKSHIQYPSAAFRANISGKVALSFVIEKDGSVNRIQLEHGIGFGCDEEAIRVVESMPRWTPGQHGGEAVAVKLLLPVSFVLE